ncbi:MAG: ABC transporter permease [Paenibacillus sp. RIFOXYA1_FULL_44_5]|nr:MAG: ABC transporter permease [Paenibacillus sp. RIFOXYA1_FULL_44_5]
MIFMLLLSFTWIIPLLWSVSIAFRPPNDVFKGLFQITGITFQNFVKAWHQAPFGQYYIATLIIVLGILAVQLVTTVLSAYAFARLDFLGKQFFFIVLMLQLMIPMDALIAPNYLVMSNLGLVDTKLAVMLPHFASAFSIFLLRQTFKQIPREFDEAAVMEGAKWWHILPRIYIPSAKPTLIALALTVGSYNWNNYLWPLIVTNSTVNRPVTVGLALFSSSNESGADWSMITAGMLFVAAPLIIAFMIFQRQFINSFLQTGVK